MSVKLYGYVMPAARITAGEGFGMYRIACLSCLTAAICTASLGFLM